MKGHSPMAMALIPSIRGWQAINASDMLIIPDPDSARIDPYLKDSTLEMICDVA